MTLRPVNFGQVKFGWQGQTSRLDIETVDSDPARNQYTLDDVLALARGARDLFSRVPSDAAQLADDKLPDNNEVTVAGMKLKIGGSESYNAGKVREEGANGFFKGFFAGPRIAAAEAVKVFFKKLFGDGFWKGWMRLGSIIFGGEAEEKPKSEAAPA